MHTPAPLQWVLKRWTAPRGAVAGVVIWAVLSATAQAGPDPCTLGSAQTQTVTNSGFAAYTINGAANPSLTMVRGCSYTFSVTASGHPFLIKSVQGTGVGNAYNDGVTNNGTQNGSLTWTVAANAPDTLFYNCQFHSPMTGTISVIDGGAPDVVFGDGFE